MKLKILFFIENLKAGGAEKVLCDLVNNMDQSKFAITVQTVWRQDAGEYLVPGIRYKYMYAEESSVNRIRYRAEAAAGLTYLLHIKDDYDIECAYLEMGPTKIMAQSTNKKAVKLAWVHCDLSKKVEDIPSFVQKTKGWYSRFDHIICVSENVRDSFIKMFGMQDKTEVLYNTIDDDAIRKKSLEPLPNDISKNKLTAVSLGRLTPQKGFDRLLRIHCRLIQEGVDYELWIAGEGDERTALQDYIDNNNLTQSARLLGFRENPYPILKAADLLVCSSRYEGLSTFITEGLILGKPIVTTDCTGMREILGNSEYGLITENKEDALFDGMQKMIKNSAFRNAFAAKAENCRGRFTIINLIKNTEDFFEILKNNNDSRGRLNEQ